jgi:metallo-beta-lactamase class B
MRTLRFLLALICLVTFGYTAHADTNPDWTTPLPPFQIADNLYYVGSRDLASYLITTPKGNILINANLSSAPPQIRASIEKLGFKYTDTKILLNAQAHFDHSAGAAEIVRETHAQNEVMDGDVDVMESGGKKDFLASGHSLETYPPAHVDRVLHDGDKVTLGSFTLTAHKTAGHTRGCTTWTFRVHLPGDPPSQLRNVVIIGGMSFWSEYHFIDRPGHPASYPGIATDFQHTFATLHALPCDIFLGAHGSYFDMLTKLQRLPQIGPKVWIDPQGYKAALDEDEATFNKEFDRQRATAATTN